MEYNLTFRCLLTVGFFSALVSCKAEQSCHIKTGGREVIEFRTLPFELTDVKLLDGPFLHATQLDEQVLLKYEPDRFLAKFRKEAGLKPKAEHYGGWEDNTIAGHSLGHYLTAISQMYQTTGNEAFRQRADYIVDELYECQQADGHGQEGGNASENLCLHRGTIFLDLKIFFEHNGLD